MKIVENKAGITMITLTIAVLILIIISSMLIYYSTDSIDTRNLGKMYNDIEELSDKIQIYYLENRTIPILTSFNNYSEIESQISINDNENYYVIDLSKLKNVNLNYGRDFESIKSNYQNEDYDESLYKDVYIINEQSMQIYYIQGIKVDDVSYYTKNADEQNIQVNVTKINSIEDLVRFSQSVNSGDFQGQYVVLTKDLDFLDEASYDKSEVTIDSLTYSYGGTNELKTYLSSSGTGFTLIGTESNPFTGVFDGKNFVIYNLYVNGSSEKTIFSNVTGEVKYLVVE